MRVRKDGIVTKARTNAVLALPSRTLKRLMPELEHFRCHLPLVGSKMSRRFLEYDFLAMATLVQLFNDRFLLNESIGGHCHGCQQASSQPAVLSMLNQMCGQPLLLSGYGLRLSHKRLGKCQKFI